MRKIFSSVTTLTALSLVAALGVSLRARAQDNRPLVKPLPIDPGQDYLDLSDLRDLENAGKPAPASPPARTPRTPTEGPRRAEAVRESDHTPPQRETRKLRGRSRAIVNASEILRVGDYLHAYELYTKIYEDKGQIYLVYPVLTRADTLAARAPTPPERRPVPADDRFDGVPDERTPTSPALRYPPYGGEEGRIDPRNEARIPDNGDELVTVYRDQWVMATPQIQLDRWGNPLLDQWGRPVFTLIPAHIERVAIGQITRRDAANQGIEIRNRNQQSPQQGQPPAPMSQDPRDRDGFPNPRGSVDVRPPAEIEPTIVEESREVLALSNLRRMVVKGASSVADALRIIERDNYEIKRNADRADMSEKTPAILAPLAP